MRVRWFVLLAIPLLWWATASAQDNPDFPWGLKNADLFATNAHSVNWLFSSGGVVDTPVSLGTQANRPGGHYEVQIMFDSQGNLYVRGSTAPNVEPNNSVRIFSLTPDGTLRWRSDNIFGNFSGPPPIVGQNAVYGIGTEYGQGGPGTPPVIAALDKNTGATLWTRTLPEGEPGYAAALYNGVLYVATRDYLRSTGEEDIPTVTIYALNAANGAILRRYDVTVSRGGWTATPRTSLTIVPNAFGPGAHGLYFTVDRGSVATDPTVFGINLATGQYWATSSGKANHSHIIYSPVTNELIKVFWSDYGQTIATFDPRTGAVKHQSNWRNVSMIDPLRSLEDPNTWLWSNIGGHGYCDTAALLPDGTSVITAGFGGVVTMYTREPNGAYTGRILTQGPSYWGEFHNMAQLLVPIGGGQPVWLTATRSERSETGQTAMVVAIGALTGEVLWQYDTRRGTQVDLRGGAVMGPSGYVYYMTPDNVLHILKPAPAPQIDGAVEMPGYVGPANTGSGDGEYTAAIPLTLEFRQPGTQTVQFRKTVALSVKDGVGTFKLNNIPAGTYDIAAKEYIQFFPWSGGRTFQFSRTIRALAPNVTVPANGTGSVAVTLTLFAGDIDGDNDISLQDFGAILRAFGTVRGEPNWTQLADLDGDEEISLQDISVFLRNFGLSGEE